MYPRAKLFGNRPFVHVSRAKRFGDISLKRYTSGILAIWRYTEHSTRESLRFPSTVCGPKRGTPPGFWPFGGTLITAVGEGLGFLPRTVCGPKQGTPSGCQPCGGILNIAPGKGLGFLLVYVVLALIGLL